MKMSLPEPMGRLLARRDERELERQRARRNGGVRSVIESPLPIARRLLLASLLGFFIAALTWAALGRIDVVAFAQGQTVASSRVQPVQSLDRGLVTAVLVDEGDRVQAGQPVIHLGQSSALAQAESLRERLQRTRAARRRLEALMAALRDDSPPQFRPPADIAEDVARDERQLMHGQWRSHRAEIAELEQVKANRRTEKATVAAEIRALDRILPYSEQRVDRLERLAADDLASQAELDDARRELLQQRSERGRRQGRLNELAGEVRLAERRIERASSRFEADINDEYASVEDRIARLREQLAEAEGKLERRTVRAPRAGIVQNLAVRSTGTVVEPAEILMRIVPADQPLEVEARILNQDIGFAEPGQRVKVKFDAFDFTRFGAVAGTIRDIAPSSTEDEQLGHVYHALVELDRNWMDVDGERLRLRPGMTATVDIEIGERRLIEYFLGPILRYRDEALRER